MATPDAVERIVDAVGKAAPVAPAHWSSEQLPSDYQALIDRIKQQIRANTTPRHVPAKVVQVSDIPRTKSGKIVELAVRNVVHGEPVKNVDALANPEALEEFRDRDELKS